ESVSVTFAGQTKTTVADAAGKWMVYLKAMKAETGQTGQTLTVTGKNTLAFKDVLLGEVWICSGQSNMQVSVASMGNATQEIANAKYPQMRLFWVPTVTSATPQEDCGGGWAVCSPQTVPGFSAVGYYFGRDLHEQLQVPVGLINTSWGGTIAEAWTSESALRAKLPEFNTALDGLSHEDEAAQRQAAANYPALYKEGVAKRQQAVQTMYTMEDDLTGAGKLAATGFDDSAWKTMKLPGDYKALGLPNVDGIVWFRKTIQLPAAWAGKEIILRPGPIDEVDNAWFNGVLVGGKGNMRTGDVSFWSVPREYHVPGNLVKAGANVIAIRVFNASGQGGLWGASADSLYAELADGSDKTHIALSGDWRAFAELILPNIPPNPINPNVPSKLYNAMIHPLIPYAIQGAIWYQGESNASRAVQYQTLLPTMITDWRTRWNEGDFPFLIVSLANYMARVATPSESQWAELREAQTLTTTALPKVGQAITIDIGDKDDIHPKNKQDVGLRLCLAARAIAYGQKIAASGPLFKAMKVKKSTVEVTFQHTDGGLVAKGDTLTGFAICGADKKFVWAQAKIDGNKVILSADGITHPVAVRYAWANNPERNLYNGAGLPAVPFRTDMK
ncbi:MAG TPA: sialate O-acetylesterase, partial [Armatimonadota bacterium]